MESQLDIRYLASVLRRRWAYFAAPALILGLVAVAISVLLPPVYVSSARILVESQQIPEDFVRSSVTSVADERIQVIQQRVMTRGNLLDIARKFGMRERQFAGESSTEIVEAIRDRTSIERVGLQVGRRANSATIAFTVSYEDEAPEMAARVAGEFVTLILKEDARSRRARATETTEFLESEARRVETELAKMEGEVAAYKTANQEALPERLPFHLNAQTSLREELARLDEALRKTSEDMEIARLQASGAAPGGGQDPLIAQLQTMNRQLAEISAVYSESHPRRKRLVVRIAALEKEIGQRASDAPSSVAALGPAGEPGEAGEGESERSGVDPMTLPAMVVLTERHRSLTERRDRLMARIAEIDTIISRTSDVELGLRTISRRLDTARTKLGELWRKHEEARLGERLEDNKKAERFEVIEQPTVPTEPARPNRFQILAVGLFAAFAVGGASLIVPELVDSSFRSPSQLSARFDLRPLAVIPYFVTAQERRRRFLIRLAVFLLVVIGAILATVAVHFLYMPLDLIVAKLAQRFGL